MLYYYVRQDKQRKRAKKNIFFLLSFFVFYNQGQKTEHFSLKNRYFKWQKESKIIVNQGTY